MNHQRIAGFLSAALLLTAILPGFCWGKSVCVSNAVDLANAFAQAENEEDPFTIKIVKGSYSMAKGSVYVFASVSVAVQGGYEGQDCYARDISAANTVIDAGGVGSPITLISYDGPGGLLIEGVTLKNTDGVNFTAGDFGLTSLTDTPGQIDVRNVRFTDIHQDHDYPNFQFTTYRNPLTLTNVLFDRVDNASDECALRIISNSHSDINLVHVTADLKPGNDFCFLDDETTSIYIVNSILWGSTGGSPIFRTSPDSQGHAGTQYTFDNDIYNGHHVVGNASATNSLTTDPLWVSPSTGNYQLRTSPLSPAINTATSYVGGGAPDTDVDGNSRPIGSAPDRGAYESMYTDQSNIVVTNRFDSGPGSLRDAINLANANPSPPKKIVFDIRDSNLLPLCPAQIAVFSPLPALTGRMTIDGYSQLFSKPNTDPGIFNANICVLVTAQSSTLPYAFTVPANSFGGATLRGMGIGGFAQPVRILGGQGSIVAGNQFGGIVKGVELAPATLSAIVIGPQAGGDVIVGGANATDRNVIVGAAYNGIDVQTSALANFTTCQVINNLIGVLPDGITAKPNNVGINISGNGCVARQNQVLGNTSANIWINGGSGNRLENNYVGQSRGGLGIANANTTGILVQGSDNVIGNAGLAGGADNIVRFMGGAGVVIKGDTSLRNSIAGNVISDNGVGGGMDIDLLSSGGSPGPTANDAGDLDDGPNHLINFPVLTASAPNGLANGNAVYTVRGSLDNSVGLVRVDFYAGAINPLGRRGRAERHVASGSFYIGKSPQPFTIDLAMPLNCVGCVFSATTTDEPGNTSELSVGMSADSIFVDGLN